MDTVGTKTALFERYCFKVALSLFSLVFNYALLATDILISTNNNELAKS